MIGFAYFILRLIGWGRAIAGGPKPVVKRYVRKQGFRFVRKVVD